MAVDLEQRIEALNWANEVKIRQRTLKRELRAGTTSLVEALSAPSDALGGLRVYEVLSALPRAGRTAQIAFGQVALENGVNLFLPVVVLTPRQRDWVMRLSEYVLSNGDYPVMGNGSLEKNAN